MLSLAVLGLTTPQPTSFRRCRGLHNRLCRARTMFTLGTLELDSNLFLSPLAGFTNLPFRLIIREIGGVGLCTTDLVNARALLMKQRKSQLLVATRPQDRPLAVQLYGTLPEEMRDAAVYLESLGVSAVDVNMGCPVPKVVRHGGGVRDDGRPR